MEKKIILLLLPILIFKVNDGYTQDPIISQYYAQPLYLAPSFAGLYDVPRLILSHREQWAGLSTSFSTDILSFDTYYPNINSGVGFVIMSDRAGVLSNTSLTGQYSYNIKIGKDLYFRPGLELSFTHGNLNNSELIFGDQITEDGDILDGSVESLEIENRNFFDASVSALVYSPDYWVGLSFKHLTQTETSVSGIESSLPVKVSFLGGWKFNLSPTSYFSQATKKSITAAFTYWHQGDYNQLSLGTYYNYNNVDIGLWYRGIPANKADGVSSFTGEALIVIFGYAWTKLRVSYSYDFTLSNIARETGGSHEIVLTYSFRTDERKKIGLPIPCPTQGFGTQNPSYPKRR